MKKAIIWILALCLCLALAGCKKHQHEWAEASCEAPRTCAACGETEGEALGHTWVDATCTEKKTCSVCGATEGEPLGHTWTDATCTVAKTCSVCGATEGEPLGHTWVDANYQEVAVCSVCGETEGEVLTPDFDIYGIVTDMKVGEHYDYETICYDKKTVKTVGDLTVLDYNIITSDDTHEAKDGYEWRIATFEVRYTDDNAWNYGYQTGSSREDYYNIRLNDNTAEYDDNGVGTFHVSYHGQEMACTFRNETLVSGWQESHLAIYRFQVSFQVPVGYDGCVYGVRDAAVEWPDEAYIFDIYSADAFHLFRFA